jgi:hypothetical protein
MPKLKDVVSTDQAPDQTVTPEPSQGWQEKEKHLMQDISDLKNLNKNLNAKIIELMENNDPNSILYQGKKYSVTKVSTVKYILDDQRKRFVLDDDVVFVVEELS